MHFPGMDFLRSFSGQSDSAADLGMLARRKKGPQTIFVTETITSTLEFNTTFTIEHTVFLSTTIRTTDTKTITSTDTKTVTSTMSTTHSKLLVVPTTVTTTLIPTLGRIPPDLSPIWTTKAPTNTPVIPRPTPLAAQTEHHLSKSVITAIVIAAIAFLALLSLGAFFGIRKFLKKYRAERVMRKKLQTEGNEMPELPKYSGTDPMAGHTDGSWL